MGISESRRNYQINHWIRPFSCGPPFSYEAKIRLRKKQTDQPVIGSVWPFIVVGEKKTDENLLIVILVHDNLNSKRRENTSLVDPPCFPNSFKETPHNNHHLHLSNNHHRNRNHNHNHNHNHHQHHHPRRYWFLFYFYNKSGCETKFCSDIAN